MKNYIYRILSPRTKALMTATKGEIQFAISWPFVWNAASEQSWDNAEREDTLNPGKGYMDRHMARVGLHLVGNVHLENSEVQGLIPRSPGVNDPFEGYVIAPETIRGSDTHFIALAKRRVSKNWRSICFSRVSCDESAINDSICKKIKLTKGYEFEYRDYVYAEFNDNLYHHLLNACVAACKRVGLALTTVHYWDETGCAPGDRGQILFPPYVALGGFSALAEVIGGRMEFGPDVITGDESRMFINEISSIVPFKYKPAYGSEDECRFSFLAFDGWNSDVEIITVNNSDDIFRFGTFDGNF
jgi:hypothetical protein